ncbi:MAG TPA: hypothetical protein VKE72_00425 [Methylocella sp.]|nr:hypothetical protein [Methylocella sp.]
MVTLKPQGNSLVGSGQSQEGQLPVTVILNRKKTADGYSFSGSIKRGTTEYEIASDDNKDMSESELSDNQSSEEKIEQNPPNFAANAGQDIPDVAPNLIGVRVKREALASLVNELKKNGVKVHANGLMIGCAALRSGDQIVNLQVIQTVPSPSSITSKHCLVSCQLVGEGHRYIRSMTRFAFRELEKLLAIEII